jgi:hypothetical protein
METTKVLPTLPGIFIGYLTTNSFRIIIIAIQDRSMRKIGCEE